MATSSAVSRRTGSPGLKPWELVETDGRYYGRGTADNKGQHTINLAALGAVLATRGRLGFNLKWLIEMGEEVGSPGLRELCAEHHELFAADVLIASDGPRLAIDRADDLPRQRAARFPIDLWIDAREGGHHSGNWGGLLAKSIGAACACARNDRRPDRRRSASRSGCQTRSRIRCARRWPTAM